MRRDFVFSCHRVHTGLQHVSGSHAPFTISFASQRVIYCRNFDEVYRAASRTCHHPPCKTEHEPQRGAYRTPLLNYSVCRSVCLPSWRPFFPRFTCFIARPDPSNRGVCISRRAPANWRQAQQMKTSKRTSHVRQLPAHSPQLGLALLVLPQLLVLSGRQPHDHAHHERLHLECETKAKSK